MTAEVCEPLWKLTSVKAERSWNRMYQDLFDKTKKIMKQDTCVKFCDASRSLCLETNVPGTNLGAALLHVREAMNCGCNELPENVNLHPTMFASKSLLSADWRYRK